MSCEKLSRDLYRGESKDLKTGQVFGGQVLGQAIKAASDTVSADRRIRSAHAYFLRKGDVNEPIIYNVDSILNGGSVSSRTVLASQNGKQILHMSASFHVDEKGLEFQPEATVPLEALNLALQENVLNTAHFQSDYLDIVSLSETQVTAQNAVQFWVKAKDTLPDDDDMHNSVMAYISDMGLLSSALVPHREFLHSQTDKRRIIMVSIDHAIWFHRPFRADDWLFYDCRAVSTSEARGLSHGSLYNRDGVLIASTTQEGLLRIPR